MLLSPTFEEGFRRINNPIAQAYIGEVVVSTLHFRPLYVRYVRYCTPCQDPRPACLVIELNYRSISKTMSEHEKEPLMRMPNLCYLAQDMHNLHVIVSACYITRSMKPLVLRVDVGS